MKKNYFLIAIVLLVTVLITLTSCSKRENPVAPEKEEPKKELAFSKLSVTSNPDSAGFYLDGTYQGLTPLVLDSLVEGGYQFTLKKTGWQDSSGDFSIDSIFTSLNVMLKRIGATPVDTVVVVKEDTITTPPDTVIVTPDTTYGYLVVNHNETTAGSGVYVDGEFVGWIGYPELRDTLVTGWHNLKVSREGYKDFAPLFLIEANKPTPFDPILVPLTQPTPDSTGRLTLLLIRPRTASYQVKGPNDGLWTGTLEKDVPIHIEGVVAGDYTVSASAEGYLGFLETRKVGSGNWTHDFRIELDHNCPNPPSNDSWVNLMITPEHTTINLDNQPWGEGINWVAIGNHSVTVSKTGWISQTKQFTTVAGETTLVEINLVEEEPEPPVTECFEIESDGSLLYFQNVISLGWEKVVFNGSSHNLFEVFFNTMTEKNGKLKFKLNDLPYDDYKIFTLVNGNGHWYSKNIDCHPTMNGVYFNTDIPHENWFRFDWNGRQDPTPPPTKGTFKLNVLTVDATVKLNNDYWPLNGEWQLDPGEYRLVVSKTGYNTHDETFNLNADETVERIITLAEEEPTEPYLIVSQVDSIISFNGTEAPKIKYVKVWVPVEEQGDGNWWTAEWLQVDNKKVNVAGMKKRYIMTLYIEQNDNSNWHGSWGRVEAISPVEKFYYTSDGTWNLKFQPEM